MKKKIIILSSFTILAITVVLMVILSKDRKNKKDETVGDSETGKAAIKNPKRFTLTSHLYICLSIGIIFHFLLVQ